MSMVSVSAATIEASHGDVFTLGKELLGNTLHIGDKNFAYWQYLDLGTGVSADEVYIQALQGQSIGIAIIGSWQAGDGDDVDAQIWFRVTHDQELATIIGSSLAIGGSAGDDGLVTVHEDQCAGGLLFACNPGHDTNLFVSDPGSSFDSVSYDKAYAFVDVFKDIGINGPGAISRIEQYFIQEGDVPEVPEPTTMLLFSTALLGLGFMRRKKS